jgi:hypothetical protein
MTTLAHAQFSVANWKEEPFSTEGATKLSTSHVAYRYTGDLEGESTLAYVMHYGTEKTGTAYAFERFTGKLCGKQGSFVLEHVGTFDGDGVRGLLRVVPGSGTGELRGLTGSAALELGGHQPSYPLKLAFDL